MSTLVLVPQEVELTPLLEALRRFGYKLEQLPEIRTPGWIVSDLGMAFVLSGHGKAQTAVQAQYAIDRIPGVTQVLCVGGAGGISRVSRGDIVVATQTVEHDYRLRFVQQPPPVHVCDAAALAAVDAYVKSGKMTSTVHFGIIASGDEDVVDLPRARELAAETNALCVAWEGAGAARAASFNDLAFLEIRVITDSSDEHAAVAYHAAVQDGMARLGLLLPALRGPWAMAAQPGAAPDRSSPLPRARGPASNEASLGG